MTLELTPEQKKERRKLYKAKYGLALYHLEKINNPEKHKARLEKATEAALNKYYKNIGKERPAEKKPYGKIKIDMTNETGEPKPPKPRKTPKIIDPNKPKPKRGRPRKIKEEDQEKLVV